MPNDSTQGELVNEKSPEPKKPAAQPGQDELAKKVSDLEVAVWNQEHRLIFILRNFFIERRKLSPEDPRRAAAVHALLWRIVSPATVAAGSIGITALVGVALAWQANGLLREQNQTLLNQTSLLQVQTDLVGTQNTLLSSQNAYIQEQNVLAESARRSALIYELTSILDEIDEELDTATIQTQAVQTRGTLDEAGSGPIPADRPRRRDVENPPMYRLSDRLTGRIVALSRSVRPYRYLDDEGRLLTTPLSPERGQLLISLIDSGIDMEEINHSSVTFSQADLRGADLSRYDFTHIRLNGADLSEANLSSATFHYARMDEARLAGAKLGAAKLEWSSWKNAILTGADLNSANLEQADLSGADLTNADLAHIKNWQLLTSVRETIITSVRNPPEGFVAWALENGARQ